MPVSKSHLPPTPTPRKAPPAPELLWPTHTVSHVAAGQFEFAVPNAPAPAEDPVRSDLTIPRSSVARPSTPADAPVAPSARSSTATKAFLISLPPFAMHSGNARIFLGCCERGSGARTHIPAEGQVRDDEPSLRSRVVSIPPFSLGKT